MKINLLIIGLGLLFFKTEAQTSILKVTDSILQTGNYQAALLVLEKVKNPDHKILEKIASIYGSVGNNSKAIEFYSMAFEMNPSDKVKEQLGKSHQFIGNSDRAIELFEEVLNNNSENLLLKYNLAKLYISERKVNKAIDLFKELSEKDSLNPNYPYQLGAAYEKLGQKGFYDSANSFFNAYILDSLHLKSIYNIAKFYEKLKFKDSTSLFIDKGLSINPKSINFNQLKAKNSFYKKEFDTTLIYLKRLEELEFKTMFTYKMYGLTYLNMKNYEKAEEYFKIAQRKDLRDASVNYNLGLVYKEMKQYKKAEMHFFMSMSELKPDTDKHYFELGQIQLAQKDLKKAHKYFEEGFKNNRGSYLLLYQLALVSDSFFKDKKIALKHYEIYVDKFLSRDEESTLFAKRRIKEITKELFIKGEKVD